MRNTTYTYNNKQYKLTNQLENVLVTTSDLRKGADINADGIADYYQADVQSANDYYSYGSIMPGRYFSSGTGYRYGFNGQENDNEVKGVGNLVAYELRIYDARLGRWLSTDPLEDKYPGISTYVYANNNSILYIDPNGKDWVYYNEKGEEIGRTKARFGDMHWLTGDVKVNLTAEQVSKGGFVGYGLEMDKTMDVGHTFIIIKSTGDIYEVLHPTDPKTGRMVSIPPLSDSEKKSQVYKYDGDPENPGISNNKNFWDIKIYNKEQNKVVGTRGKVSIAWIWVDYLDAVKKELEARFTNKFWDYNLIDFYGGNCKEFVVSAIEKGFNKGSNTRDPIYMFEWNFTDNSSIPIELGFGYNCEDVANGDTGCDE